VVYDPNVEIQDWLYEVLGSRRRIHWLDSAQHRRAHFHDIAICWACLSSFAFSIIGSSKLFQRLRSILLFPSLRILEIFLGFTCFLRGRKEKNPPRVSSKAANVLAAAGILVRRLSHYIALSSLGKYSSHLRRTAGSRRKGISNEKEGKEGRHWREGERPRNNPTLCRSRISDTAYFRRHTLTLQTLERWSSTHGRCIAQAYLTVACCAVVHEILRHLEQ